MRIALVYSRLTVYNGIPINIQDYANELNKKGYEVYVIAQKITKKLFTFDPNVKLLEVGGPISFNPLHWITLGLIKGRFINILKEIDPDVVVSHNFPANYFCSEENEKKSFTHIFYCHEPYLYFYDKTYYSNLPPLLRIISLILRTFFKRYDYKSTKKADGIICNSNFIRNQVLEVYREQCFIQYPVLNMETLNTKRINLFKKLGIKPSTPLIFVLGLTHNLKGVPELLYIFKMIIREISSTVLLIGGHMINENKKMLYQLINKLDIPKKNIILFGFIEKSILGSIYESATLTLYTAIGEGFGQIPVESMKYGTPIIAFNYGGPTETIINNKTGFLIQSGNLEKFADKAIQLIQNERLRKRFSKNCIIHIHKNFNFKNAINRFELLIKKIHQNNKKE
jgi:glycosyltransferase involved in cell wall biosynthesis